MISGKQARRIKASSPLGELSDHGCDAIASTILVLFECQILRLGNTYFAIGILFALMVCV